MLCSLLWDATGTKRLKGQRYSVDTAWFTPHSPDKTANISPVARFEEDLYQHCSHETQVLMHMTFLDWPVNTQAV